MSDQIREGQIESAADERLVDRRTMLRRAAATAAGLIGALALPATALAATGDPAKAGQESTASAGDPGLWGSNSNLSPEGGVGVRGESKTGDGMVAVSQAANKSGIWAKNVASGGAGVTGDGDVAGVVGRSTTGHGTWGWTTAAGKAGVYGHNTSPTGQGVFGLSTAGTGVLAQSNTGLALRALGKTAFSRSGMTFIGKGKASVTISVNGGVTAYTRFLVTMQGSLGTGVYVAYAKAASATTFTVTLNKKATKKAAVAWMAID
jgi:hypothetical protein